MNAGQKKKAVFLDRDGVINAVVHHQGVEKPSSPWTLEEFTFMDGVTKPLIELKNMGFLLFIFSNQPDIARGNIKPGVTEEINSRIKEKLPIDDIAVCPHDYTDNCDCRKPKPGLLLQLADQWNIALSQSFVIGDSWKDIEAGNNAGCTSILIETYYNKEVTAFFKCKNLQQAISIIKKNS